MREEQNPRRCDFFVSYTGVDTAWAEWIAWQLKQAGYAVTIQAWHFRPGSNFVALMGQALDTCHQTIAVVSQAYLDQSTYGSDEWTAAFTHDDPTSSNLLLVLVERVDLPRLLRPWIHISLTGLEPEQAAARLLDGVRPGPAEPTTAPAFPGRVGPGPEAAAGPRYPGHHPEVANLPARNAAFAGRDDLLGELHTRLHQQGAAVAVVPAQALFGLGGVGKTQLALEYAHRYQADYDLIWWIVAEAPGAIPAGLAALAPRLGLVEDPTQVADQELLAAAVLEALRRRGRWLLVFDNVPDRQQLAPYLPQGDGQVLITSRSPVWGGTAQPIKVDTFTRAESVAFLTQRTSTEDLTTTDRLAEELGDLPLALEQAAAYLEQTPMPLPDYLGLFRRRRAELLGRGEPTAYQGTVDTTWQLAIEQVATIQPGGSGGVAMLRLCAFLAPEAIPLDLLTEEPDLLPAELAATARDELALGDAVAALYRFSLVDRDQAGLRVHRLVQAVVRGGMDEQATRDWAAAAVRIVAAAFPPRSDDVEHWRVCQWLLPHALAAAEGGVAAGVEYETAAAVNNRVALYLWARAELQEAQQLLQQTYTMIEEQLGPEHLCSATNLGTQGKVLRDLGDLNEARRVHVCALRIRKRRLGSNQLKVAWSYGNLGKVLRELGRLDRAKRAHEQALQILEVKLAPEDPDVAWGLGNLGRTLKDLGDLDQAKQTHERALAIRERHHGANHPDVAWSLRHLGDTLHVLAQRPETRDHYLRETHDHYQRALTIFTGRFGPHHPEVSATRRRLQFLPKGFGEPLDQSDAGFQLLFDGANLRPWWRMAGPGYFVVLEGGVLQTEGGMGLLWYADRRFRDFILRLDWMATSPDDNSGVFVRSPDPGNDPVVAVNKGYEVQIDDRQKSRYEGSMEQTGAIYKFKAPKFAAAKLVGEWNSYEIKVVGHSYTVILNGHKVVDDWTGTGGRGTEGYVGLQNHHRGSRVRFRNLRLKEL